MTRSLSTGPENPAAMGAADEQARKRQLYEEALDRFAGFEPGESQLSHEEIMARRAARAGQTARRQSGPGPSSIPPSSHPPFEAILGRLMATPGMYHHLNGIDLDGDGDPDVMLPPLAPPPMDPMGRMQWRQMARERAGQVETLRRRMARDRMVRKQHNDGVLIQVLAQSDPLFPVVHPMMDDYIRSLPLGLARHTLDGAGGHAGLFLELYKHIRDYLVAAMGSSDGGAPARPAVPEDPREAIRKAVAGRMSPPQLESAGAVEDRLPGASREAERKALVKRVKAGGAREGDLLRYLELCGV